MMFVVLVLCCLCASLCFLTGTLVTANGQFNVLFVSIDDLRWNLEDPLAITPYLDEFAADAVTFTHAFSQFAKCAPSRNSFLSGMRPDSTRCYTLSDKFRSAAVQKTGLQIVSLPQYFKDAGTHFAYGMGKNFHAPGTCACPESGQDWPYSWNDLYKCFQSQKEEGRVYACSPRQWYQDNNKQPWNCRDLDVSYFKESTGNGCLQSESCLQCLVDEGCWGEDALICAADCPDECFMDYLMTTDAVTFIDDVAAGNHAAAAAYDSWFLGVGYLRPHTPFIGPLRFFEMYDIDNDYANVSIATNRERPVNMNSRAQGGDGCSEICGEGTFSTDVYTSTSLRDPDNRQYDIDVLDDSMHKPVRGAYYATVSYIDDAFGRLITSLKNNNLYDETVIVVVSDHGFSLGELGQFAKTTCFDIANRAPLMIRIPGLDPSIYGKSSQLVVELLDIFPTLVEAVVGLDPNDPILYQLEGKSLMPIINSLADSSDVTFDSSEYFALSQIRQSSSLHTLTIRTENWRYSEYTSFHEGDTYSGVVQDGAHPYWENAGNNGVELYNFSNEGLLGPSVYYDYNAWDNYNYAYENDVEIESILAQLAEQLLDNWDQTSLNLAWRLSIFSNTKMNGTWQTLPSLTLNLYDATVASCDKSGFYVFGGLLDDGSMNQILYKYNIQYQNWTEISPSTTFTRHSGQARVAEVWTGKIYTFGGGANDGAYLTEWTVNEDTGGTFIRHTSQITIDGNVYTPIGACSARISHKMYVAGGYTDQNENVLLELDLVQASDERKENLPNGIRIYAACGAYDGYLYVFGGRSSLNDASTASNDTIVYDPDQNVWSQMANMPFALSRAQLVELNGKFIIVGGETSDALVTDTVLAYDPEADEWDFLPNMMTPRFASVAVTVNNVLYSVSGTDDNSGTGTDVHEALPIMYWYEPTQMPTTSPSERPSDVPSSNPSVSPSFPTMEPTIVPSARTNEPSIIPSIEPTNEPSTLEPSNVPSVEPTNEPSTLDPSNVPSIEPTNEPSTLDPSSVPSIEPTQMPVPEPTEKPTLFPPTSMPTNVPSKDPSSQPSETPSDVPSEEPSAEPSSEPSETPSSEPSSQPTDVSTAPTSLTSAPTTQTQGPTSNPITSADTTKGTDDTSNSLETTESQDETINGEGGDAQDATSSSGKANIDGSEQALIIALIVVGCVLLLAIVGFLVWKRKKSEHQKVSTEMNIGTSSVAGTAESSENPGIASPQETESLTTEGVKYTGTINTPEVPPEDYSYDDYNL